MAIYALLKNSVVENIIEADTQRTVEIFFPDMDVVAMSDDTGHPNIGLRYNSVLNKFAQMQPYESWIFNDDSWSWQAPIEYPSDGKTYAWDEKSQAWTEIDIDIPFTEEVVAEEPSV